MLLLSSMKSSTTTVDTRFFRAGVGTVIYNQSGQVALFKRAQHPVGIWQFQQGGIDLGEDFETTLWRELKEEIGLTKSDFESVREMPFWTVHQNTNSVSDVTKSRLGQAYRWFFLELKEEVIIDITKAEENEVSSFRWASFEEAISEPESMKKHIYQQLEKYFNRYILTDLNS